MVGSQLADLGYYITFTSSGCVVQGRQSYKPTVIVTSSRLCYTGLLNQSMPWDYTSKCTSTEHDTVATTASEKESAQITR